LSQAQQYSNRATAGENNHDNDDKGAGQMHHTRNFLIFLCALIPIWIVVGQDFTPSIFDREDGQIPLNPRDPSYDPWSQLRDTSADPDREPGPFFLGRLSNAGVLTFFDLPVAFNQADLIAGEVDVAIMGAQIDMGVGMRGAKYGPGSLRESLPVLGVGKLPHMHVGISWQRVLRAVDYGNALIDQLSV